MKTKRMKKKSLLARNQEEEKSIIARVYTGSNKTSLLNPFVILPSVMP
jgi:type IV secretory pathway ATPase VirB11/archaellum biosynthesis ATPase